MDGANSVNGAQRAGFPYWELQLGVAVVVGVLALRLGPKVRAALLLCGALPGFYWVMYARADAPLRREATAQVELAAATKLREAAPWPGAKLVAHDDVLAPLARYAWPTSRAKGPEVEVRGECLEVSCRATPRGSLCTCPP